MDAVIILTIFTSILAGMIMGLVLGVYIGFALGKKSIAGPTVVQSTAVPTVAQSSAVPMATDLNMVWKGPDKKATIHRLETHSGQFGQPFYCARELIGVAWCGHCAKKQV